MTERHYVAEDCCILYGVQCSLLHGILFHAYCTLLYCYLVATYMYACVGIHLCDNNCVCCHDAIISNCAMQPLVN